MGAAKNPGSLKEQPMLLTTEHLAHFPVPFSEKQTSWVFVVMCMAFCLFIGFGFWR